MTLDVGSVLAAYIRRARAFGLLAGGKSEKRIRYFMIGDPHFCFETACREIPREFLKRPAGIAMTLSLTVLLFVSGCATSDFGVKRKGIENWIEEHQSTTLDGDVLSVRTRSVLERMGKTEEYESNPDALLKSLHALAWKRKNRKFVAALIELCYNQAEKHSSPEEALPYYMSAAVYAHTYLFDRRFEHRPSPYEPEFLYAARFYDYASAKVLRYLVANKLVTSWNFSLPYLTGKVEFQRPENGLPFKLSHFKDFKVCYDYFPFGFHTLTRQSGIGVPFVALGDPKREKNQGELFDIGASAYPGTLLLKLAPDGNGNFSATPTYIDPMRNGWAFMSKNNISLEVDLTTYLGFVLNSGPKISPLLSMMNPKRMEKSEGLYLLTPYDKNKIPVVLVHGLMSYPRAWTQMINTLLGNSAIRSRYQFWLFAYPTANPVLYSAYHLRKALLQAREQFDPKHDNPNFNRMVLVGHSMGGLLSKIMVQNSGDTLLEKRLGISSVDELRGLDKEHKELLKQVLIYKRLPFVNEVVFLNVPHKGSLVTRWTISMLAAKLIGLPSKLVKKTAAIQRKVLEATRLEEKTANSYLYTGVDNLDPDNLTLKIISSIPIDKHVVFHSIIGNNERAGVADGTDGIVPYKSAHIDGAASELIIHSDHSGQKKPAAILEVERILLEHLRRR